MKRREEKKKHKRGVFTSDEKTIEWKLKTWKSQTWKKKKKRGQEKKRKERKDVNWISYKATVLISQIRNRISAVTNLDVTINYCYKCKKIKEKSLSKK